MDDDLVAGAGDEYDDLEQVAGAVGTDDEPPIGVLAEIIHCEGSCNGVCDVIVIHAVPASRSVNLHTAKLYYEKIGVRYAGEPREVSGGSPGQKRSPSSVLIFE